MSNMTIGKKTFDVEEMELNHFELKYYPQNPRIFSLLSWDEATEAEPSQLEIENQLVEMDHVKQLAQSIKANGGLIDPLIVRGGDNIVLEGNSRLAAYRLLSKKEPINWDFVKCKVLPKTITDDAIFALLGQYHIIGRKDWSPFEQAGYLYRRVKKTNITIDNIAIEMGLSSVKAKRQYEVYECMKEYNDANQQKWSHYEEFFKSRSIKAICDADETVKEKILEKISRGEIVKAIDVRDKLSVVAKLRRGKKEKVINQFISGEKTLDECYEIAEISGVTNDMCKQLKSFRDKIVNPEFQKKISKLEEKQLNNAKFELNKIARGIKTVLNRIEGK
jgi:hypothetical protein